MKNSPAVIYQTKKERAATRETSIVPSMHTVLGVQNLSKAKFDEPPLLFLPDEPVCCADPGPPDDKVTTPEPIHKRGSI